MGDGIGFGVFLIGLVTIVLNVAVIVGVVALVVVVLRAMGVIA